MDHQPQYADAAAVDRVGTTRLMEHFDMTRQAVSHWRRNGVPKGSRRPLKLLGESLGLDMSDLTTEDAKECENGPLSD